MNRTNLGEGASPFVLTAYGLIGSTYYVVRIIVECASKCKSFSLKDLCISGACQVVPIKSNEVIRNVRDSKFTIQKVCCLLIKSFY